MSFGIDDAAHVVYRQPRICGGLRSRRGVGNQRADKVRGNRGVYNVREILYSAAIANGAGSAVVAVGYGGGRRVFDFLGSNEMQNEDGKSATLGIAQGKVEFSHVKFGYEDSDKTVIRDFPQ